MLNIIAVSVGNTRTQLGRFVDGELVESRSFANADLPDMLELVLSWWGALDGTASMLLASVNEEVSGSLARTLQDQLSTEVYIVGEDVPVPIGRRLAPETITGVDRLLNAAAAYDKVKQACIIVDAGTALTVDFVDGDGTFHGGAICPGAAMQLKALHDHTSALPELTLRPPEAAPFGRSTAQAMLQGVFHGIRGAVQRFVERYAEEYGAFPTVIATGGDAELLFASDELVTHVVPDLALLGIAIAGRHALAGGEVEGGN